MTAVAGTKTGSDTVRRRRYREEDRDPEAEAEAEAVTVSEAVGREEEKALA